MSYAAGLLGLALLIVLVAPADWLAIFETLRHAGGALLWLLPYRVVFFLAYAVGWRLLLRPYDPQGGVGLGYLLWVTTIREGIDRLLPVASVGGGVIGIRLLQWRGLGAVSVAATVLVEIVLTLVASYLFAVLGLALLVRLGVGGGEISHIVPIFLLCLPIPVIIFMLMRHGAVFARLQRFLRPLIGDSAVLRHAVEVDREVRDCLGRGSAIAASALHFAALLSASVEVWFALRLFGHPVDLSAAVALEGMNQAVRHVAFFVPAGLGVQEAGLVMFGHFLGIDTDLALAVSTVKRMRELLWGIPALATWQWAEARRLSASVHGT